MPEATMPPDSHPRLLLVGAGEMGRGYLAAALLAGLSVGLVERPARFESYQDQVAALFPCTGLADQHWIAVTISAARQWQPASVLAFAEPHVLAAAWAQDMLGLPGPSLRAAVICRDKALQRLLLNGSGVDQPEFAVVRTLAEASAFAAGHLPVVIKALRSSGSAGVTLVSDIRHLARVLAEYGSHEPVLAESYVDGPEFSCEALVHEGAVVFRNYTRKLTTGPPDFVEIGHILPAAIPREQQDLFDETVSRIVASLGIVSSLVHLEFRVARGRPYVMETAVRTPGDHIMELLSLAYGQDFFGHVIRLYTGQAPKADSCARGVSAIRYLEPRPGSFAGVEGLERAVGMPGVVRISIPQYEAGAEIRPLRSSRDRGAYVILQAESEDEIAHRMELLRDTLQVVTR